MRGKHYLEGLTRSLHRIAFSIVDEGEICTLISRESSPFFGDVLIWARD